MRNFIFIIKMFYFVRKLNVFLYVRRTQLQRNVFNIYAVLFEVTLVNGKIHVCTPSII